MKRPLSSLIPEPEDLTFKLLEVEIQKIQKGKNQARTKFDKEKLAELVVEKISPISAEINKLQKDINEIKAKLDKLNK